MTGIGVFLACLAALLSAAGANVLLSEVPCKGDTAKQKYTLVFEGLWSEKRFPKQYPIYRPKASWSSLVGKLTEMNVAVFVLRTIKASLTDIWNTTLVLCNAGMGEIKSSGHGGNSSIAHSMYHSSRDTPDSRYATTGRPSSARRPLNGRITRAQDVSERVSVIDGSEWMTVMRKRGVTHNEEYTLWHKGETASEGVKLFAEKAGAYQLFSDIANSKGTSGKFFADEIKKSGVGERKTDFAIDADHSKVSFMVKIVPSPDWFVGLDSKDLCQNGKWIDQFSTSLGPWDAGTDKGFTFTSPNWATVPQEPVFQISAQFPNHPANSFYYPSLRKLPALARVTLTRDGADLSKLDELAELVEEAEEVVSLDCDVSNWSGFSRCTRQCGGGIKARSRYVTQKPLNGGKTCPELAEIVRCNEDPCDAPKTDKNNDLSKPKEPVKTVEEVKQKPEVVALDCEVSKWSAFSKCSSRCGGGSMVRSRNITQKPSNGGKPCPQLSEKKQCNVEPCPVTKEIPDNGLSKPETPAKTMEKEQDEPEVVATDCKVSDWSGFSKCNRRCGGGVMVRSRTVTQKPSNGGKPCPQLHERKECNVEPCPVTETINTNDLSKPETSTKTVEKEQQETTTAAKVVATDCKVSGWSGFSKCNRRCGGGVMVRSRTVTQKPSNGGKPCPQLYERKQCNVEPCPVTKAVSENDLSKPVTPAKPVEKEQYEPEVVASDCKVSEWSRFGRCNRRCGGGIMVRARTITQKPLNGGKPCPHLYERKRCNLEPCPVRKAINVVPPKPQQSAEGVEKTEQDPKVLHCEVSNWSGFSRCSRRCGGGLMVRSRYIRQKPVNGGTPCPRLTQIRRCNLNPCPAQLAISSDDRLQRLLARFRLYGRRQQAQQVYITLIRPVLEYGHVLLVGCNKEQEILIERVQRRALRIISLGGRREVPPVPTLKEKREVAAVKLLKNMLDEGRRQPLRDLVPPARTTATGRTLRNGTALTVPAARTKRLKSYFLHKAICLYNVNESSQ
ncbi:Spondin-2 [Branchiostoma belcheri]|nr:Spondin-2 [Branchiostoma belcheri]